MRDRTDAIWLGSPQPQIMAFRAFQITPEFQERFGYPELTDERKRKILGLNAANLLSLDPEATRCALAQDPTANRTASYRDLVPAEIHSADQRSRLRVSQAATSSSWSQARKTEPSGGRRLTRCPTLRFATPPRWGP